MSREAEPARNCEREPSKGAGGRPASVVSEAGTERGEGRGAGGTGEPLQQALVPGGSPLRIPVVSPSPPCRRRRLRTGSGRGERPRLVSKKK